MRLVFVAVGLLVIPLAAIVVIGMMLPREHVAVRSIVLKHSPEDVWRVISGPPDWQPQVERYEKLPDRDGHPMWREYGSHGRSIAYERLAFEPPRKMMTRIAEKNLPYSGTWTYEITPRADGSELTVTETGAVENPVFRFVSRYVMGETATIDAYLRALGRKLG